MPLHQPESAADPSAEFPLSREAARELRSHLCAWFGDHRRALPWRRRSDAYAIWISEAMLQQTRVETVIPYWERFLDRLPTNDDLAGAPEEELLALWSGLGYYRRARSLRLAAIAIRDRFEGRFPDLLEDALSLPGVGPYTAGAVLSIAYDLPVAAVDGNVLRVFSRFFGLEMPWGSSALNRKVWKLAESWIARGQTATDQERTRPGAWNQALMELGATVCTAKNPSCDRCPWSGKCFALERDRVELYPVPGAKRKAVEVELETLLVVDDGRLLLKQRSSTDRMAGLLECPTRELVHSGGEPRLYPEEFARPSPGSQLRALEELAEIRHSITHHRIRARIRAGELPRATPSELPPPWRWIRPKDAGSLGLTGMTTKLLKQKAVADFLSEASNR